MDEEPDFERDFNIGFPAPLDPHIASVWLDTDVNRYSEGYPLKLSASFGLEFVTLGDGDLKIPVEMSLRKAAISISFRGCIVGAIQDDTPDQYRLSTRFSHGKARELSGGLDGGVDRNGPSGKVGGKGTVSSKKSEAYDESLDSGKRWRRTTEHSLELAMENGSLSREVISGHPMWFVKPHHKVEKVQVVAVLSARADWIHFGKVDTEEVSGKSAKKFLGWWRRATKRDKELYRLLLSKLAEKGLQSSESRDATLAIYPHALRRYDPSALNVVPAIPPSGVREIPVDTTPLIDFTEATPEVQIDILNAYKVPMGAMNRILVKAKERPAPQRGMFNAGSAPPTALNALKTCVEARDGRLSKDEWDILNHNRSRHDLVALNLIAVDGDMVISLVPDGVDPEDALRYEARKAPMLQKTREVLLENPNAKGIEIGEIVGRTFNRRYDSDKSKLRVGNALRRWAFWLEEGLIDPQNSDGLARLRASARSEQPGVGAPTAATPENLALAQEALDRGERAEDIAKRIGVSRAGFYGWASRGLLSLPSKRKPKDK
ncbi:hypothetical protein K3758_05450 [Sulfitobacter sp. W002]|uniref:hypothetical protein n=1 Tax=Sulfitobacter sp. W002 TaxID=2867024 RepID=UPI0021A7B083|nr:hypothetical protein [Sulfitobacter sp. W002]UWR30974.1 hypothetical protein K3758_05450 [Sulfitobacter sp. W002]